MGKYRKIDTSPGRQNRQIAGLRRALRQERSAKRLASAEAGTSGSTIFRGILSVVGLLDLTGTMSLKSGAGNEIIRMGDMPQGDRGLEFKREDGTPALTLQKAFDPTNPQAWALFDRSGNTVVAEGLLSNGLLRPHLEHPFQPVAATSATTVQCGPYGFERTHASTTWTTLFAYDGKVQNGFLDLKFAALCSDGTTSGEIQVVDLNTGTPLPGLLSPAWVGSIPTGTTTMTIVDPAPDQVAITFAGAPGVQMRLGIQVRRTAGAGTITLAVPQSIGG